MGVINDIASAVANAKSYTVPMEIGVPRGHQLKSMRMTASTKAISGRQWKVINARKAAVAAGK